MAVLVGRLTTVKEVQQGCNTSMNSHMIFQQAYLTTQTWWWVTGSTYAQIATNAEYYVRYYGPITFSEISGALPAFA